MLKKNKGLGIRERRRIYDETISIVAQNKKMCDSEIAKKDKSIKSAAKRTHKHSSTVIMLALGYHEEKRVNEKEEEYIILCDESSDENTSIMKEKFDDLILQLPENKELKTLLWKSCVKNDKKAYLEVFAPEKVGDFKRKALLF